MRTVHLYGAPGFTACGVPASRKTCDVKLSGVTCRECIAAPVSASTEIEILRIDRDEWRSKALDVEKHPVVVLLQSELRQKEHVLTLVKEERDALQHNYEILEQGYRMKEARVTQLEAEATERVAALTALTVVDLRARVVELEGALRAISEQAEHTDCVTDLDLSGARALLAKAEVPR